MNENRKRMTVSASQVRLILMGAIGALFINNLMITSNFNRQLQTPIHGESQMIPSSFYSTTKSKKESIQNNKGNNQLLRNPRILMGIFSSDNMFDATHRKWHRRLFNEIWKDERVCTLSEFRSANDTSVRENCQLIYTFVAGANQDPEAPTERLEETDTSETPIELPGGYKDPMKIDANWSDVTHLNIR